MSTITFDTFKFVERLEKSGVPREQAAAMAEAQKDAFSEALDSNIVTRGDLAATKSELKADITLVRTEIDLLRKDMQSMELRLVIKLGTFFIVAVGILAAVLRLPH